MLKSGCRRGSAGQRGACRQDLGLGSGERGRDGSFDVCPISVHSVAVASIARPLPSSRRHRVEGLRARPEGDNDREEGSATYTRYLATLHGSVIVRVACACGACRLALVVHHKLRSRVKLPGAMDGLIAFCVQEVGIAVVESSHCNWGWLVRRQTSSRVRAALRIRRVCWSAPVGDGRALLLRAALAAMEKYGHALLRKDRAPLLAQRTANKRQAQARKLGQGVVVVPGARGASKSVIGMEPPGTRSQAVGKLYFFSKKNIAVWLQRRAGVKIVQVMSFWRAAVQVECGKP